MYAQRKPAGESWRSTPVWVLALLALLLAPTAHANTTFFNDTGTVCSAWSVCWQPGTFGVLVGLNQSLGASATLTATSGSTNGDVINGEVGIGTGSYVYNATNASNRPYTWTGPVDFADAWTGSLSHGYHVPNSTKDVLTNTTVTGGVFDGGTFSGLISTALGQVDAISDYWATWTASGTMTVTGFGTQDVHVVNNANTLGHGLNSIGTTTAGVYVYNATYINTNAALSITVGPNTLIIINDRGTASFGQAVSVTSGYTDQVLFNLYSTSSGTILSINDGGRVVDADFIVRAAYNLSNVSLNGRLLGGAGTLTLGAAFALGAPPDLGPVPEPEDWLLLLGGLGAVFYAGKRHMRRQRGLPLARRFRERLKADAGAPGECVPVAGTGTESASSGDALSPPEIGLPPPRGGGGGGGSGGMPFAREP